MSVGAWMMLLVLVATGGILAFLIVSIIKSMVNERSADRPVWREFGLSLALMTLFLVSWAAQAVAEWQTYTDNQHEHGQPVAVGDFVSTFAQSTLENWQSEFLQLFVFVVLAALYIHRGSAESKDSDEKVEAALRRIEQHLGTLPDDVPREESESWKLPDPQVQS
jgi:F0F1-type ATP synthase membrane subunit a